MELHYPGITLRGQLRTYHPSTGAYATPSAGPTGAVYRNGTLDAAVTVTVAATAVGRYDWSAVVPGSYAPGDHVVVNFSATVAGITNDTGDRYAYRLGRVPNVAGAPIVDVGYVAGVLAASEPGDGASIPADVRSVNGTTFSGSNIPTHVIDIAAAALAKLFTVDTGQTYASAAAGSPVREIAANAAGAGSLDLAGLRAELDARGATAAVLARLDVPVSSAGGGGGGGAGDGDTAVDSAYGGLDLRATVGGVGVGGVTVRAYLADEYAEGTYALRAQVATDDDGSWGPMYLDAGLSYTLTYSKDGYETAEYGPLDVA